MRTIVRIKFGSHLYGTSTPMSDIDYINIFVPPRRDILLQRVKSTISTDRPKREGEKNYAGEIDEKSYSIQRYLQLLSEGQTVTLDMLFAPSWSYTEKPTWEWQEIIDNHYKLLTRKSTAFLGYCRQQANKYGIKGSRVSAAHAALNLLEYILNRNGSTLKLSLFQGEIERITSQNNHMSILDIEGATDINGVKRTVRHWEVCNRKMPFTQTIKSAYEVVRRIVDEYGHRARQAESNQGVDWEALSHAVRVGEEAVELFRTGYITFPRPDAHYLVAIKTGQLSYEIVANKIEELLESVEREAKVSTLPETVDIEWIDDFVCRVHWKQLNL